MIQATNITMKFDLNRGKVTTLKEKLFAKVADELTKKEMFEALKEVSLNIEKGGAVDPVEVILKDKTIILILSIFFINYSFVPI